MQFWKNKNVLITGHTGFKGTWLSIILKMLGAKVTGISLPNFHDFPLFLSVQNQLNIDNIYSDLTKPVPKSAKSEYDFIFHLAAQSLVSESYVDPLNTYRTNILSTVNTLEFFSEMQNKCVFINVTSDKCYLNLESSTPYKEDALIGGLDHYSASKACCEIINHCYQHQMKLHPNKSLISVRSGNVIGGGDWAKDRLIPDLMRHLLYDHPITFRDLDGIRPWQHVLEPLTAYLKIARNAYIKSVGETNSFNIGPDEKSFRSVGEIIRSIQELHGVEIIQPVSSNSFYETKILKLNIDKILSTESWKPQWGFDETLLQTYQWYKSAAGGKSAFELCERDIQAYGVLNEM